MSNWAPTILMVLAIAEQRLPIGTRIRFTKRLDCEATGDHPAFLYASVGELGEITGHGTPEGYWAKTDHWPNPFGVSRDEFEPVLKHF